MHAFDYVILLFSFVYAAAVTHLLSSVGDQIIAARRIRFSWLNAGWMLASLFGILSWWISTWDLRSNPAWSMPFLGINFLMACLLYVLARLVTPRIGESGKVDVAAFHQSEGRKYIGLLTLVCAMSIGFNVYFGQTFAVRQILQQNIVVIPMTLASAAAAIWIGNKWVQRIALAIELAMWLLYYGTLQGALSG